MSNYIRQRRRRTHREPQLVAYSADKLTAEQALLVAARAAGCSCSPTIELAPPHAYIRHDAWCRLIRSLEDVN